MHGGATGCGFAATASPDVEENRAAGVGDSALLGGSLVVGDEELEGMCVVALAHLGIFFPL